jgi:hypothetical protein
MGRGCSGRSRRSHLLRGHHRARTGWHPVPRFRFPFQPLQVGPHIRRMLLTQLAVFLEPLIDDIFQLGRKVRILADGGNRVTIQNFAKDNP